MSWFDDPHRGTRDLHLLGFGDPSAESMVATFREMLTQEADDGVVFDAETLQTGQISEELEYGGLRLQATASIGGARINLTIDIGFGDALEPTWHFIRRMTSKYSIQRRARRRRCTAIRPSGAIWHPTTAKVCSRSSPSGRSKDWARLQVLGTRDRPSPPRGHEWRRPSLR